MRTIVMIIALAALLGACSPKESASAEAPTPSAAASEPAPDQGVSIPTGETGGMCGGIAGVQCLGAADYCAVAEGECVQIADFSGTCTTRPEVCTEQYDPVCGCDGKTYGNACAAAAAGVSVGSKGECPKTE